MEEIINEDYHDNVSQKRENLELTTPILQDSHCRSQTPPESLLPALISPNFRVCNSSSDTVLEGESNERICDLPLIEQKIAGEHLINMPTQEVIVKIEDTVQDLDLTTMFRITNSPRPHQNNISASTPFSHRRRLSSKSSPSPKKQARNKDDMCSDPPLLDDNDDFYSKLQQITSKYSFTPTVAINPVSFYNTPERKTFPSKDPSPSRKCKSLLSPATLYALSPVKNLCFQSQQAPNNTMLSSIPNLTINPKLNFRPHSSNGSAQTSKFKLRRRPVTSIGTVKVSHQSRFFSERNISSPHNLQVSSNFDEFDETINQLKHKLSFVVDDDTVRNIDNNTDQDSSQPVNHKPITNLLESLDIPYVQNGQDLIFDSDNEESVNPCYFLSKDLNKPSNQCFKGEPIESRSNSNGTVCFSPKSDTTVNVSDDIDAPVEILSSHKIPEWCEQEEPHSAISSNGEEEEDAGNISKNLEQSHQSPFFQTDAVNDKMYSHDFFPVIEQGRSENPIPTNMEVNPSSGVAILDISLPQESPSVVNRGRPGNSDDSSAVDANCKVTACDLVPHTHANLSEQNHSNIHLPNGFYNEIVDQKRDYYMTTDIIQQNIDEADLLDPGTTGQLPRLKRRRIFRVGLSKKAKVKPLHPNLYKKAT